MYDTEESPLSSMHVVWRKPEAREGQLCNRNEPSQAYNDPEGVRLPELGWNEHLRRGKSKQARKASIGPGRMQS